MYSSTDLIKISILHPYDSGDWSTYINFKNIELVENIYCCWAYKFDLIGELVFQHGIKAHSYKELGFKTPLCIIRRM